MTSAGARVEGAAHAADAAATLAARIEAGRAACAVLGVGYVGLPLAVELARAYPRVIGVDTSAGIVAGINAGTSHVADVPDADVAELVGAGRLVAAVEATPLAECDAIIICVPTPLSKTRDPDVSHVVAAADAIAASLRSGQLVILESTTFPGTTRELVLPRLEAQGARVGEDFFLCFSPERVDPGNDRWHIRNTPKVIGGITERCTRLGSALYERVIEQVVTVSSVEAAELTKLLENTFRAVNIALVNEMAQVCDRLGADVFEVIEAAATKPFGFMKFTPGPGIGGHCIPLDPHYLAWKMKALNYRTRLIELASEINAEMPHYVLAKATDVLNRRGKAVNGSRVLIIGAAYKRDVPDTRESPALDLIRLLAAKGADVCYHDPLVPELDLDGATRRSRPLDDALFASLDLIVIATDHTATNYQRLADARVPVLDTRNAMKHAAGGDVIPLSRGGSRLEAGE